MLEMGGLIISEFSHIVVPSEIEIVIGFRSKLNLK